MAATTIEVSVETRERLRAIVDQLRRAIRHIT
jgi:predicted transcriptional regulator